MKKTQKKPGVLSNLKTRIGSISLETWVLLGILVVGAWLRFVNFPNRYGFDYDSSRDAFLAFLGATQGMIPPLGPASALGGFQFGPLYYYQLILFRIVFPTFYSPWIYVAILSVVGIFIGYKIGEALENRKLGLMLAAFIALSPAQILLATGLSNPNVVVLPSLMIVWLAVALMQKKRSWVWSFVFGIFMALGINNHFQMLPMLLLPLAVFFFTQQKKSIYILSFISGFFVTCIPYLLYEITHQFSNTSGFIYYLTDGRNAQYLPNSWRLYLLDFWIPFATYVTGLPLWFLLILGSITSIGILYQIRSKTLPKSFLVLLVVFFLELLFLRFVANREYYYLVYIQPLLFLFLSYGISWLINVKYGKIGGFLLLILGICLMISPIRHAMIPPESHAETKVIADYIISQYPEKNIIIHDCGERMRGRNMGVVYLLTEREIMNSDHVSLGIYDGIRCDEKLLQSELIKKQLPDTSVVQSYYNNRMIRIVEFVDTNATASISGWGKITPETIYEENAEKAFK